jgi:cell division GTPase FtsZ
MADNVLYSGVRGVTDLMIMPGLINLDFADIRAIMSEMGKAMMGTGEAEGDRRALDAAEAAISNPLLDDVSLQGASGVLINITGGFDMTLYEVDEAANRIREEVETDANIIFGSTFDDRLNGKMRVSVVATGIGNLSDVNAFKKDIAAGFNSAHKSSAMKMFEGIDIPLQQQQQNQQQDNISENYQEEVSDHVEEADYELSYQKKPSSFFDRFRNRGSAPVSNQIGDDAKYQKRATPIPMPKQSEIQQMPVRDDNADEEDYDIPSCFRRKK